MATAQAAWDEYDSAARLAHSAGEALDSRCITTRRMNDARALAGRPRHDETDVASREALLLYWFYTDACKRSINRARRAS